MLAGLAGLLLIGLGAFGSRPAAAGPPAPDPVPGSCTPLDLAFVIDDSGSMQPALDNVKAGINDFLADATTVSGGNLRLEVISYEVTVDVHVPFSLNNETEAKAAINALQAERDPRNSDPAETSDEALRTAVFGLPASARSPGQQNGDAVAFRPEAEKMIILIGDARPAGFDDEYTKGVDDVNAIEIANAARDAGIRISAIYAPDGIVEADEEQFYTSMAGITGGQFTNAGSSALGTAGGLEAAVADCGELAQALQKCKGKQVTQAGTAGNDTLVGTPKRDVFSGGSGNDRITGKGGKDLICGGAGNDKLKGGAGKDKLYGGGGRDKLAGGGGRDKLAGGGGRDKLIGGPGKDKLNGGPGNDRERQ